MKAIATILVVMMIIVQSAYAQDSKNDYKKFDRSFSMTIAQPGELLKLCKGSVCLLKVTVDSKKNITDMQLSDSADSLFKVEFSKKKNLLKTDLLVSYLRESYSDTNCPTYIIPIAYSLNRVNCSTPTVPISTLFNYYKFNGSEITGNIIMLAPIETITGNTIAD